MLERNVRMLENLVPTLLVIGYTGVALLIYFRRRRLAFAGHARHEGIDDAQKQRFALFDCAEALTQLQCDTNYFHEKAIAAKNRYETFGIVACCGAPALIFLAAVEPLLHYL